jgi:hypothetical protein
LNSLSAEEVILKDNKYKKKCSINSDTRKCKLDGNYYRKKNSENSAIRRIMVQSQPEQIVFDTLSPQYPLQKRVSLLQNQRTGGQKNRFSLEGGGGGLEVWSCEERTQDLGEQEVAGKGVGG